MHYCHKNLELYDFGENLSKILEIGPGRPMHLISNIHMKSIIFWTLLIIIQDLKRQGYKKIKNYDGVSIPYSDESFDEYVSHVLEHINNPHNFLLDLIKKLKKGGVLSICYQQILVFWKQDNQKFYHYIKIKSLKFGI